MARPRSSPLAEPRAARGLNLSFDQEAAEAGVPGIPNVPTARAITQLKRATGITIDRQPGDWKNARWINMTMQQHGFPM